MAEHPSDLRTPLSRVRFLGSARVGTNEAWLIHLTSLALVPLTISFVWLMLDLLRKDYNGVRAELTHPIPAILLLAFIFAGIVHMELGMRSVIRRLHRRSAARLGPGGQHLFCGASGAGLPLRDAAGRLHLSKP